MFCFDTFQAIFDLNLTLYEITSKISTDIPISNHAPPPLPQIPNLPNSNVHNYVLSEYKDKRNIGKGRGLIYPDTRLIH